MFDTIGQLLHPHEPEQLEQAIRRRERLYLPAGRADAFAGLLPWPVLNSIVTAKALSDGQIGLVRENRFLPLEMSTSLLPSSKYRERVSVSIHSLAEQGVSLVVNWIGRLVPEIEALNRIIERSLGCAVNTNAYVSFNKGSAFKAHWDDHDVLVLQVSGRKRWLLYGHPYDHPVKNAAFAGPTFPDPGPVERELVMSPGDILFVPRGDVHKAVVEGESSVHLTIGLRPRLGHEAIAWLAREAQAEDAALRRDILPIASPEELDAQEAALRASLHRLVDRLDIRRFIADDHAGREFEPALNLGFTTPLASDTLVRPALLRRVDLPADGGKIVLGDRQVSLTTDQARVLTAVLKAEIISVGDLAAGAAGIDDVPAVVGQLAKIGLVELVCESAWE